ncbi:Transcriptional regulator, LysR family [Rhodovulum sp. P5]|nr:Transcriptional regulator, LysR family [Rhodovulum sp. P5]
MRAHLAQMTTFAQIVRLGSVTAAAEKLGVTQSAVSQTMQKLETAVGAKLYFRSRDGIQLTATGQQIFELADRQADLEQLIAERIAGFARLDAGHLSVIANAPLPALRLIAGFGRSSPGVEIDFALFDWTTAIDKLRNRQVDIAVITDAPARSDWMKFPVATSHYVAYMQPSHRLAGRDVVTLSDLCEKTLLLPERGSLTQRVVSRALDTAGLAPRRVMKTMTFPLMKEAILQGIGVGVFLSDSTAETADLCTCRIAEIAQPFVTDLVVPKDKLDLHAVKSFVNVLRSSGTSAT